MAFLDNSGVTALVTRLKNYFALKTDIPTVPTAYTSNPQMDGTASAGSGTLYARGNHVHPHDTSKQDVLVSGTNIKTINGESLLGSGDITVGGGGGGINKITLYASNHTAYIDLAHTTTFLDYYGYDYDAARNALESADIIEIYTNLRKNFFNKYFATGINWDIIDETHELDCYINNQWASLSLG